MFKKLYLLSFKNISFSVRNCRKKDETDNYACETTHERSDGVERGVSGDNAAAGAGEGAALGKIKLRKAIYPILIGLAVVGYMFWKDFDPAVFNDITFSWVTIFWLLVAFLCMFGRDLGYVVRLRVLSGGQLSWRQALRVIMLWEFTSAVTPSAVGGTSVAIIYVHKEGIGVGRSSAIVMLTSFLDELYFIVMFPLVIAVVGFDNLFEISLQSGLLVKSLMTFAMIGYGLKLIWVIILSYGLFINPRGLKWLLMKIFKLRFLRRWYHDVNIVGTDIINSSNEIRRKNWKFWFKSGAATFLSWSSRYLVANALVLAFFAVSDQVLLFARQLVMWVMMLVMPTPGGSGFAELFFTKYCADLIEVPVALQAGAATLIAFLWRGVTYYPYLAIGAVIFPRWLGRNFGKIGKTRIRRGKPDATVFGR